MEVKRVTPSRGRRRILFYRVTCPHCHEARRAVSKFNADVPPWEEIDEVNIELPDPRLRILNNLIDKTKMRASQGGVSQYKGLPIPVLVFDGYTVIGVNISESYYELLKELNS